nr:ABC transporter C family member 13 [Tanacetum cinerariifolium]
MINTSEEISQITWKSPSQSGYPRSGKFSSFLRIYNCIIIGMFLTSFTETEMELVSVEMVLQYMDVPQEELHEHKILDANWSFRGKIQLPVAQEFLLGKSIPKALTQLHMG